MDNFDLQFFGSGGSPTQSRNLNTRKVPDILSEEALQNFDPTGWIRASQRQYNPLEDFDSALANVLSQNAPQSQNIQQNNNALNTLEQFDANTQEALVPQQTMQQNYSQPSPPVQNTRQAAPKNSDDAFRDALNITLKYEGGYVNHKNDRGGATNFGITTKTLDEARNLGITRTQDVRNLTQNDVNNIYHELFWKRYNADKMPKAIAIPYFDAVVHHGPKGQKLLQKAINSFAGQKIIAEDGRVGNQTLNTLNSLITDDAKLHKFLNIFLDLRDKRFDSIAQNDPTQRVFLKGWHGRVSKLRNAVANRSLGNSQSQAQQQVPQVTPTDSDMNIDFSQDIPQAPTQNYYPNYFDYINSPEYFQRQKQQWGGI